MIVMNDIHPHILQKDDPKLRKKAVPVPLERIKEPEIREVIRGMKTALEKEEDGVAIAAPQIGIPYRIFIVSHRAFEIENSSEAEASSEQPEENVNKKSRKQEDKVFINPEIINKSKKTEHMEEGCLSVRWWYGVVERYRQATVKAIDENGNEFQMGASGLLSQIFQHEIDHLNGILFTDKATDLKEFPPQNGEDVDKQKM